MNTTPQSISRILKAAGITQSKSYKGRITSMSSEGYRAEKFSMYTKVEYRQRTASFISWADFKPHHDEQMARIKNILEAKGYEVSELGLHSYLVRKVGA